MQPGGVGGWTWVVSYLAKFEHLGAGRDGLVRCKEAPGLEAPRGLPVQVEEDDLAREGGREDHVAPVAFSRGHAAEGEAQFHSSAPALARWDECARDKRAVWTNTQGWANFARPGRCDEGAPRMETNAS
jgi:hypothetical protein